MRARLPEARNRNKPPWPRPVSLADRAPAEQTPLDEPGNGRKQLAGSSRNAVGSGQLTAGQRRPDKVRAAVRNVLDRSEQKMVDSLGEAPVAGERVGFLEPGTCAGPFGRPFFLLR